MKGDWISAVDHDAGTMTICAGPKPDEPLKKIPGFGLRISADWAEAMGFDASKLDDAAPLEKEPLQFKRTGFVGNYDPSEVTDPPPVGAARGYVKSVAPSVASLAPPDRFALQYAAEGTWCWTCDAGGYVLPFDEKTLALAGELPAETRRIPWAEVPARLKRIVDCGNRKARRAERAARRRELWTAHKRGEKS